MIEPQRPVATLQIILRLCLLFSLGAVCVGGTAILFWGASSFAHKALRSWLQISPYLPLVVTPLGFALSAFITNKFFLPAIGSGIPQIIAAVESRESSHRGKLLTVPIAAAKLSLTALAQFCGGSIGQEGPMVQIGGAIMYSVGQFIPAGKLSQHELDRLLILSGSAAGIAATFSTPIAGIIFALEQFSKAIDKRTFAAIVAAVVIAFLLVAPVIGGHSYLNRISTALPLDSGWIIVPISGIAGGILGGLCSCAMIPAHTPKPIMRFRLSSPVLFAALCGFIVAVLGLLSDSAVYGNGSRQSQLLLENPANLPVAYSLLKLLATYFSCFSGIPGGFFAPSLGTGAGIGANLTMLAPNAPAAAVVLLGVAAYFAGVFRAPITGAVIVAELTGSYTLLLPLLVAAAIAAGVSRLVCKKPFYESFAYRWREPGDIRGQPK